MLVCGLELQCDFLLLILELLGTMDVEVDSKSLGIVNTTDVPIVCASYADFCARCELSSGRFNWGALSDHATDFEICTRGEYFDLSQEAHLEIPIVIYFKELLEALLEHWVLERVCHDVKATRHVEA